MAWHHERWSHAILGVAVGLSWVMVLTVTLNELAMADSLAGAGFSSPEYIAAVQLVLALTTYTVVRAGIDWTFHYFIPELRSHILAAPAFFFPVILYASEFWASNELVATFGTRFAFVTIGGFAVMALADWRGDQIGEQLAERFGSTLERWGAV